MEGKWEKGRERERSVGQLQAFNNQLWPNKASKLRLQTQQPQLGNVFNMQLHLPLLLPLPLLLHLQLRLPLLMYANKLSKVISFNYLIYRMREKQKPKPKPKRRKRERNSVMAKTKQLTRSQHCNNNNKRSSSSSGNNAVESRTHCQMIAPLLLE